MGGRISGLFSMVLDGLAGDALPDEIVPGIASGEISPEGLGSIVVGLGRLSFEDERGAGLHHGIVGGAAQSGLGIAERLRP